MADLVVNDEVGMKMDYFRQRIPEEDRKNLPRVVVLGAGWGSLSFLRRLHTDKFDVTVVSPRNYFLFTPLLPSTTVGTLEVRSIMEPIRHFIKRSDSDEARFIEAECTKIDPAAQVVYCEDKSAVTGSVSKFELGYDHLVVAVGADVATFGLPGVKEHAVFLRDVPDVNLLRNKILDCFETASIPRQPPEEVKRLLSVVVVGGGPAGVEYVAELNDFLHSELQKNFPGLASECKIRLIEALPHILPMFDKRLIEFVESRYKKNEHIDLRTQEAVVEVGPKVLKIRSTVTGEVEEIPYGLLLWAAGNTTKPIVADLIRAIGAEKGQDSRRGLVVDDNLRVKGTQNIWALGDCSWSNLPATAQVAQQEGKYLGKLFNDLAPQFHSAILPPNTPAALPLTPATPSISTYPPFIYRHFGSFAYVGDHRAIAEIDQVSREGKFTSAGLITYALWRSVYMSKLLSARNRFAVFVDWLKAMVFGRDTSRG
eukprot:TRINITY_DN1473_c0_g1_i1.p1 TRINITY_DN1473_c0_g1~~TRINITY_DN1473_c0_g1_i1.p1  ORF type:complete len:541 (-),score=104.10 TRINITY_DN1473_c0_g1_i1:81-1529(-)